MDYFVTGGTGFIGRFLVARLLDRPGARVHVLVRESSAERFAELQARFPGASDRLVPLWGDIAEPGLVSDADRRRLAGAVKHVFHLAAVYDMTMDDETGDRINVGGTRNVVGFANELGDVRLHHMSSVAVAGGSWHGQFSEDMFDEGQRLGHPYFRTKYAAEQIVREESTVPFRIYRPGAVVGSSETGEIDKIDGPYFFFKAIQRVSERVPRWLPLVMLEGGHVPLAPVDYVAGAMDALAHKRGLDGGCFHLVQSEAPTVGELVEILLESAHGPAVMRRLDLPLLAVPPPARRATRALARRLPLDVDRLVSRATGVPLSVLSYLDNRAVFDDTKAQQALRGSGVSCPDLRDYAGTLWRYWELHLDPVKAPSALKRRVEDKVVLITGASSGIGFTAARKVAAAGAKVVLVARTKEKLDELVAIIEEDGGQAFAYPADLSDMESIDAMATAVLADLGHVDVLVNNAGRSIRRAVMESLDRFHDIERTMQLNYFGAVRLIMRFLPSMVERQSGHVVNISSIGVQANVPRFSAYVASKAALDAFGRCMSAEVRSAGIDVTTIYMPLVRTPMIAPSTHYRYFPTWSADSAADTICEAIAKRPKFVATPMGRAAAMSYTMVPRVNDFVMSQGYRLFPTSAAAKGKRKAEGEAQEDKPSFEQLVFANVFRGEHW
ncbi:MAG: SDR family oxidoreductase [Acidimicrobiales bacterium]